MSEPNRSDATNHVGVARDLAATLRINYGHTGELCLPSVEHFAVHNHELPIEVRVDNVEACPRYAGVCIQGVTIGENCLMDHVILDKGVVIREGRTLTGYDGFPIILKKGTTI